MMLPVLPLTSAVQTPTIVCVGACCSIAALAWSLCVTAAMWLSVCVYNQEHARAHGGLPVRVVARLNDVEILATLSVYVCVRIDDREKEKTGSQTDCERDIE